MISISLKELKIKLNYALALLTYKSVQNVNNASVYLVSGLFKFKEGIQIIEESGLFKERINQLVKSPIYGTNTDSIGIPVQDVNTLNQLVGFLKELMFSFLEALDQIIPEEETNSINIKLPPNVKDFNELSKISNEIHIALSQIILNADINGITEIKSVENGSIWLNVFLGTAEAVSLIASSVWAAAVIRKKMLESNLIMQQIRAIKVKADSLEDVETALKEETKLLLQAEAEYISSEYFKENTPENIERIKNTIKVFSEIIERGAEITPALHAPENVSNLFPNLKNILGVQSKIKEIDKPKNN